MLTPIEKFDLFLRFATVGQICLLAALLLVRRPFNSRTILAVLLAPCMVAYLVLTSPAGFAEVVHRGLAMSLVHSLPFLAWLLISEILNARPSLFVRPLTLGVAIITIVITNIIVFWLADAPPFLHQVSHWIAIALLMHLLILAIHGASDDLLPARRRMRAWFVGVFAAQFLIVVAIEITGIEIGNPQATNAINAAAIFLVILILGVSWVGPSLPILLVDEGAGSDPDRSPVDESIDSRDRALYERLKTFMDDAGFRTPNLSVRRLSDNLSTPEHQLRRLINQGLGFQNFSTFLNSYRIDAACKQLGDPAKAHIPVLTIALDLGYGSIGPFNRAFKSITGMTPTKYRQFQNRS